MNKLKAILFTICLLFLIKNWGYSQEIYNVENSIKYAQFLFENEDYKQSAKEYERIYFLTKNISYIIKYLECNRKSGNNALGVKKVNSILGDSIFFKTTEFSKEYLKNYLSFQRNEAENATFIKKFTRLDTNTINSFHLYNQLIHDNVTNFDSLVVLTETKNQTKWNEAKSLITKKTRFATKPVKAGILSAIIPGLGKVYLKNFTDGIFSFIMAAGTGYQSFKWFKRNGLKSIMGYAMGGISTGFYTSNIIGTVKEAKKQRKIIDEKQNKLLLDIIFDL